MFHTIHGKVAFCFNVVTVYTESGEIMTFHPEKEKHGVTTLLFPAACPGFVNWWKHAKLHHLK